MPENDITPEELRNKILASRNIETPEKPPVVSEIVLSDDEELNKFKARLNPDYAKAYHQSRLDKTAEKSGVGQYLTGVDAGLVHGFGGRSGIGIGQGFYDLGSVLGKEDQRLEKFYDVYDKGLINTESEDPTYYRTKAQDVQNAIDVLQKQNQAATTAKREKPSDVFKQGNRAYSTDFTPEPLDPAFVEAIKGLSNQKDNYDVIAEILEKYKTSKKGLELGIEAKLTDTPAEKLIKASEQYLEDAPVGESNWFKAGEMSASVVPQLAAIAVAPISPALSTAISYTYLAGVGLSSFGGGIYDFKKYHEENDLPIDKAEMYGVGILTLGAELIPETMRMGSIMKPIKRMFTARMTKELIQKAPGIGKELLSKIAKQSPAFYKKMLLPMIIGGVEEGTEEGTTEVLNIAIEHIYKNKEDYPEVMDMFKRVGGAMVQGAAMGMFLGSAGSIVTSKLQKQAREKSKTPENPDGIVRLIEDKSSGAVYEFVSETEEGIVGADVYGNVEIIKNPGASIDITTTEFNNFMSKWPKSKQEAKQYEREVVAKAVKQNVSEKVKKMTNVSTGEIIEVEGNDGETYYVVHGDPDDKTPGSMPMWVNADNIDAPLQSVDFTNIKSTERISPEEYEANLNELAAQQLTDKELLDNEKAIADEQINKAPVIEQGDEVIYNGKPFIVNTADPDTDNFTIQSTDENGEIDETMVVPSEIIALNRKKAEILSDFQNVQDDIQQTAETIATDEATQEQEQAKQPATFPVNIGEKEEVAAVQQDDGSFIVQWETDDINKAEKKQAALQKKLEKRGFNVELIGYRVDENNPLSDDIYKLKITSNENQVVPDEEAIPQTSIPEVQPGATQDQAETKSEIEQQIDKSVSKLDRLKTKNIVEPTEKSTNLVDNTQQDGTNREEQRFASDQAENESITSRLQGEDNPEQEPGIKTIESQTESITSPEQANAIVSSIDNLIESATDIKRTPLAEITTDEDRFQNRDELNDELVDKMAANWDDKIQDAIHIWKDNPNDTKYKVLSGHHRYYAALKAGVPTIKTIDRSSDYTEEQAIRFAKEEANANRTMETSFERAKILREKRQRGDSKEDIDSFLRNEGKNSVYVNNLSYLNPEGKTVQALKQFKNLGDRQNQKLLEQRADWIGEALRTVNGLTNSHESEMFDFLFSTASNRITTKTDFIQKVRASVQPLTPDQPLNLAKFKNKVGGESAYEEAVAKKKEEITAIQQTINDLNERFTNPLHKQYIDTSSSEYETARRIADDKISQYEVKRKQLQKELEEIYKTKHKYLSAPTTESLFDQTNKQDGKTAPTTSKPVQGDNKQEDNQAEQVPKEEAQGQGLQEEVEFAGDVVEPKAEPKQSTNKVFTEEAKNAALERLRKKRGNLNVGIDPQEMLDALTVAGFHLESGVRKFSDFAKQMIDDVGEWIKPHLKGLYENLRRYPGMEAIAKDMDSTQYVDDYNFDKKKDFIKDHIIVGSVPKYDFKETTQELKSTSKVQHTTHTKTGADIYYTKLTERVDDFAPFRNIAKKNKGSYSRFLRAFMFDTEKDAQNFREDTEQEINPQFAGEAIQPKQEVQQPEFAGDIINLTDNEKSRTLDKESIKDSKDKFIEILKSRLESNNPISNTPALRKLAEEAGLELGKDYQSMKELYDMAGSAFNQYILDNKEKFNPAGKTREEAILAVTQLKNIQRVFPTETQRSAEQVELQQFSTPSEFAYIANWVAQVKSSDTMLEPSAGEGNIAVIAKNTGAKVIANEIDKNRSDLLKKLGLDKVVNEDAKHLHAVNALKDDKVTVVVMNPPFSKDIALGGKMDLHAAEKHIEAALNKLEEEGRLVAIVGKGMSFESPTHKPWWDKIKSKYQVRANVLVSGDAYTAKGTNFDNRILVIDKNGQTFNGDPIVTGVAQTYTDLVNILDNVPNKPKIIQNENTRTGSQRENDGNISNGKTQSGLANANDQGGSTATDARSTEDGRSDTRNVGMGSREDNAISGNRGGAGTSQRTGQTENKQGDRSISDDRPTVRGNESESRQLSNGTENKPGRKESGDRLNISHQPKTIKKGASKLGYDIYKPEIVIEGAKKHPSSLVESTAMASVSLPKVNYSPLLDMSKIKEGALSDAQLEDIVLAGNSHQQKLANGERRGFFLGAGTGYGKGRTLAGIILDNFNHGRKKAIWISKNDKAHYDSADYWEAVGGDPKMIFSQKSAKKPIAKDEGILLMTYGALRSNFNPKTNYEEDERFYDRRSLHENRLQQLAKWLGKDFNGVIVFDESHNMGNAKDTKGTRGTKKASNTALAGLALQRLLPNARIIYSSATGATEVSNLAYSERLGLWGDGTPFSNAEDFIQTVSASGVAGMEIITKDLKAMGLFTAKTLSFDGVQYETLEHKILPEQKVLYDQVASAWQLVLENMDAAIEANNTNSSAKSSAKSAFWGAHQRFFNQVITTMELPSLLQDVQKQLDDNKSVVIQLVNTNEAALTRALAEAKEQDGEDINYDELDLSPKQSLLDFIRNGFPVAMYQTSIDDNGNEITTVVTDSEGNPVLNPEAVRMRDNLIEKLDRELTLPESPLDVILNTFGEENVAEITGRTKRVVRKLDDDNNYNKVEESRTNSHILVDKDAFMDGKKRILVFSDAGGTGASFHSDLTRDNQQQRVHYALQTGWRADNAVQGFGRTHRSNQKIAPIFKLVTTDLKAQRRFLSSIARRLDQLGALTKGQRQTGGQGILDGSFNLEDKYAKQALFEFYQDVERGKVPGVDMETLEKQMALKIYREDEDGNRTYNENVIFNTNQFLNRIMSLNVDLMDKVFDGFMERIEENIQNAKTAGSYDEGIVVSNAKSTKVVEEQVIYTDSKTGGETHLTTLELEVNNDKSTWDQINAKVVRYGDKFKGFYQEKSSERIYAIVFIDVVQADGRRETKVKRESIVAESFIDSGELYQKYEKVKDLQEAQEIWDNDFKQYPDTRKKTEHIVKGLILPIWNRLPEKINVRRYIDDDGVPHLGRFFSNKDVETILQKFDVANNQTYNTKQLVKVISDGGKVKLANGFELNKGTYQGEPIVKINNAYAFRDRDRLTRAGVVFNVTSSMSMSGDFYLPMSIAESGINKIIELYNSPAVIVEDIDGNYVRSDDNIRSRKKQNFYSNAERALSKIDINRGTPQQWKSALLKNGAKETELNWMEFEDVFEKFGRKAVVIPKQEVQDWIDANKVELEEVVKGASRWDGNELIDNGVYTVNSFDLTPELIQTATDGFPMFKKPTSEFVGDIVNPGTINDYAPEIAKQVREDLKLRGIEITDKTEKILNDYVKNKEYDQMDQFLKDNNMTKLEDYEDSFAEKNVYSEYSRNMVQFDKAVRKIAEDMGKRLGIKVNVSTDASHSDSGRFNKKTGEITIYPFNLEDTADAIKAILHEAVGHKGLRKILGTKLDAVLQEVYDSMSEADIKRIGKLYNTEESLLIAEEYIAEMSEKDVQPSFIKQAIAKIRELLRKAFGIKFTDNDIYSLLAQSKKYLESQTTTENAAEIYKEGDVEFAGDMLSRKTPPTELEKAFDKTEDTWHSNRDWETLKASVKIDAIQEQIHKASKFTDIGQRDWKDVDKAIHLYLDLKRDPEAINQYWGTLNHEQQRLVTLSEKLTPEMKKIADRIRVEYDKIGNKAFDAGIIKNILDNYVARTWDLSKKGKAEFSSKFQTHTRHSLQRKLVTILEGWSEGYTLKTEGASNNLGILLNEINNVIENQKLLNTGLATYDDEGNSLFTTNPKEGYKRIEHPNFVKWKNIKDINTKRELQLKKGINTLIIPDKKINKDGTISDYVRVLEKQYVYAPAKVANMLNNTLGSSGLKDTPGIKQITAFNARLKSVVLSYSFFHHFAYARSYLLGGALKYGGTVNLKKAYEDGLKAMENMTPEIEVLVRNGLTVGRKQDWSEEILKSKTSIEKIMEENNISTAVTQKLRTLHNTHTTFLFNKLGAGLKIKTALLEYQKEMMKYPNEDPNIIAKRVANLVNDDFGGLHLERLHRNKTGQHIARLLLLAPDWTESNIRTMAKAVNAGSKEETEMYRSFWARIITKTAMTTAALNLITVMMGRLLDGEDEEESLIQEYIDLYKRAFHNPMRLNWLSWDITNIRNWLVEEKTDDDTRYYFNIAGHFKDVWKFINYPLRSLKNKGSIFTHTIMQLFFGENWQGRRYTTGPELLGIDDKGTYSTTSKENGYRIGDEKGGKLAGQLTKWSTQSGPLKGEELPSFIIAQLRGWMPIPLQNSASYMMGETDAFDLFTHSVGLHVNKDRKKVDDIFTRYNAIEKKVTKFTTIVNDVKNFRETDILKGITNSEIANSAFEMKGMIRAIDRIERSYKESLENGTLEQSELIKANYDIMIEKFLEKYEDQLPEIEQFLKEYKPVKYE